MNICDIAFSTEWFLTIPGMLITGGVILLIIALIMLIVSSSKGKKKKASQNNTPAVADMGMSMGTPAMDAGMPVQDNMAGIGAMPSANMGVMPEMPTVSEQMVAPQPTVEPVAPVTPTLEIQDSVPASMPTAPEVPAMPEIPAMQMPEVNVSPSINEIPMAETTPMNSFSSNPVPEPVVPMAGVISPVEQQPTAIPNPVVDIPVIEPVATVEPVVSSIPNVGVVATETIPVEQPPEMNSVPAFNDLSSGNVGQNLNSFGGPSVQEEARPIYGGANPLEATQNLPKIDVHHEPYSGGRKVVPDPDIAQPSVIPSIDTVPSVPTVESVPTSNTVVPQQINPVEINPAGSMPMNDVVPPITEPIPAATPAQSVAMPSYDAVQPTSPVADVEQL